MAAKAEAIAPFNAAMLPPPGTGSLPATLFKNSFTANSTNIVIKFKVISYWNANYANSLKRFLICVIYVICVPFSLTVQDTIPLP